MKPTHYLVRLGYYTSLEDFRKLLLKALKPALATSITKELLRDQKMILLKDGGHILPSTQVLMLYIHREVLSAYMMPRISPSSYTRCKIKIIEYNTLGQKVMG